MDGPPSLPTIRLRTPGRLPRFRCSEQCSCEHRRANLPSRPSCTLRCMPRGGLLGHREGLCLASEDPTLSPSGQCFAFPPTAQGALSRVLPARVSAPLSGCCPGCEGRRPGCEGRRPVVLMRSVVLGWLLFHRWAPVLVIVPAGLPDLCVLGPGLRHRWSVALGGARRLLLSPQILLRRSD